MDGFMVIIVGVAGVIVGCIIMLTIFVPPLPGLRPPVVPPVVPPADAVEKLLKRNEELLGMLQAQSSKAFRDGCRDAARIKDLKDTLRIVGSYLAGMKLVERVRVDKDIETLIKIALELGEKDGANTSACAGGPKCKDQQVPQ